MKVGVTGCAGRMGRAVMRDVIESPDLVLRGGTVRGGSWAVGRNLGDLAQAGCDTPLTAVEAPEDVFSAADVVIDFTTPCATVSHAHLSVMHRTALVIGTTGISASQRDEIAQAAQHVPIVLAPNTSVGINIISFLVEETAASLQQGYDAHILDIHHNKKVDAPSGTALLLQQAVARGQQRVASVPSDVPISSVRAGDVIGEHTVMFAYEGERVEITHTAQSRHIFSQGALRAARWCVGRKPGLYAMRDVLGLDRVPDHRRVDMALGV